MEELKLTEMNLYFNILWNFADIFSFASSSKPLLGKWQKWMEGCFKRIANKNIPGRLPENNRRWFP